jgi:ketosteroid isomerase-like protein
VSGLEERVRQLEDEKAVLATLTTYCHSIDYDLGELFADLWVEDATLTYDFAVARARSGTDLGDMTFSGRDAILDFFKGHTHAPRQYHKHLLLDPQIQIDGDRAAVQSYYIRLDEQAAGPQMSSFGRYLDELVRCPDGRWRFVSRRGQAENRVPQQVLFQPSVNAVGPG